jgi:hypothetical protein
MSANLTPAETLRAPMSRPVAATIIAMALTVLILIAVVAGSLLAAPGAATSSSVADGWSAYLGAEARRAAVVATDGWSSYLITPPRSSAARDGWSSYLLTGHGSPVVTDGWLTRYGTR